MKRFFFSLCIGLLFWFSSCSPLPKPKVCIPSSYVEGDLVEACGGDEVELATWWEQFQDPTLNWLITEGQKCNYDLRIAYEKVCQSRGAYQIEFGKLLPTVDGTLFVSRTRNSATLADSPFLGAKFVNLYIAGFDANWELDFFGKNRNAKQGALFDFLAAKESAHDVFVTITSEIADNYIAIRALQQKIATNEKHIKNEKELVAITQARFDAGLTTAVDPLRAQALLQERISDLYALNISLKKQIYQLAVLLGRPPEELAHCFDDKEPVPCASGKIPLGIPSDLLCRRPDVREAEFALDAAGARLLVAKKDLLPTISLEAFQTWATGKYPRIYEPNSRNWSVLPELLLPIFDAGKIRGNILVHSAEQREALLHYEQVIVQALQDVESALVGYFEEAPRLASLEKEVSANTDARDLSEVLYESGIISFDDVIDVERDLFDSEIDRIESKQRMMTSLVGVYKALGGGWECSALQ